MDYLPLGILGRILVSCQADLAGAAAVGSTADKAECLRLPDRHGVVLGWRIVYVISQFAREVTAIGVQRRVVQRVRAIWIRCLHHHMAVGHGRGEHGSRREDRLGEHCGIVTFDSCSTSERLNCSDSSRTESDRLWVKTGCLRELGECS